LKHRPEIDGLRAIAVIPVILFHAGFEVFSGGFVGVDIFFVISGYLITTILLSEMNKGSFNFLNFYRRRANRILPVLLFISAACIPVAWLRFTPSEMQEFSKSLVSVFTFSSNIFFWLESGYFDSSSELKPLLHTWSLAIEEQYYLLFPPFLLLLTYLGRRWLIFSLSVVFIFSLGLSQWGAYNKPAATFYLLPTRGWELLLGSLTAIYYERMPKLFEKEIVRNSLSVVGLLLIIFAVVNFDHETPFPSVFALIPTIGAVLIILFSSNGSVTDFILRNRLLIGIGLVSYSAYLWHQPVFAFARNILVFEPTRLEYLLLILLVFLLSIFTYFYVEKPFRVAGRVKSRTFFFTSAVVVMLGLGLALNNLASRQELFLETKTPFLTKSAMELQTILSNSNEKLTTESYSVCTLTVDAEAPLPADKLLSGCDRRNAGVLVLIGDSHARDLYDSIGRNNIHERPLVSFAKGGCRIGSYKKTCQSHYRSVVDWISENSADVSKVVYAQSGRHLLLPDGAVDAGRTAMIFEYLSKLTDIGVVNVTFLGPRVELGVTRKQVWHGFCGIQKNEVVSRVRATLSRSYKTYNALDQYLANRASTVGDVKYVSGVRMLSFQFPNDLTDCTELFWSNSDHWTQAGENKFAPRLESIFGWQY